ncbi:MAG: DUF2934 domain-containing protein [Candidatus Sulfotelmatobacter sp.]|jgi:hypothetical protein
MARAKSTSGGKSNRNKQTIVNDAVGVPDVNAASATEAPSTQSEPETKIAPEMKIAPEKSEPEMKSAPEPKKFEFRKTEPRKNVFPINLEDEIRRRAYELFQQRGPGSGSEAEDWLSAEREVMLRYRQHSA